MAVIATTMLTTEGAWILYTTRSPRLAKAMMTKPCYGKRRKICVIFASYNDTVELEKWLEWSSGEPIKYIIAEDVCEKTKMDRSPCNNNPQR